jgi:hypothetical protein
VRRLRPGLLLALLVLVTTACDGGRAAPQTTGDFGQRTPAYLGGLIPVVDVTTPERGALPFIVDTGSPITLLDAEAFGHDQDYSASDITDLSAFGVTFTAYPTVVYGAFGPDGCGDFSLAGIVGGDLLQYYALTIDYLGAALFLWDELPASPDIGQEVDPPAAVPVHLKGGGRASVVGVVVDLPPTRLVADGALEGVPRTFLLDTGASLVTLPQRVFDTMTDQDRPRLTNIPVQTVYGLDTGYIVRLRELALGEVTVTNVPAFVVPDATLFDQVGDEVGATITALVGGTYLREFQTTVRYQDRRVELARYRNPVHINRREFVGPGFDLAEGCDGGIFVARVYPGTAAASAGIAVGAAVTAIESQSLEGLTVDEADRLLHSYDPGTVVPISVLDGHTFHTYDLAYSDLLPTFAD